MAVPPSTITIKQKLTPLLEKYEAAHPLSQKAFKKAQAVLPAGSTRSVLVSDPFPLVIKSAQGATLTTVDGITLEDFNSDFSAGIYGHSHPVIKNAVQEALSTGFSLGGITEKEAQLASILTNRFPSMDKVRFCNSGTEANTFALAAALAHTKRKKVCHSHEALSGFQTGYEPEQMTDFSIDLGFREWLPRRNPQLRREE